MAGGRVALGPFRLRLDLGARESALGALGRGAAAFGGRGSSCSVGRRSRGGIPRGRGPSRGPGSRAEPEPRSEAPDGLGTGGPRRSSPNERQVERGSLPLDTTRSDSPGGRPAEPEVPDPMRSKTRAVTTFWLGTVGAAFARASLTSGGWSISSDVNPWTVAGVDYQFQATPTSLPGPNYRLSCSVDNTALPGFGYLSSGTGTSGILQPYSPEEPRTGGLFAGPPRADRRGRGGGPRGTGQARGASPARPPESSDASEARLGRARGRGRARALRPDRDPARLATRVPEGSRRVELGGRRLLGLLPVGRRPERLRSQRDPILGGRAGRVSLRVWRPREVRGRDRGSDGIEPRACGITTIPPGTQGLARACLEPPVLRALRRADRWRRTAVGSPRA